ncbi:MAG: class I SAM-dependent methyltransferase [Phycisphaerae bacterium]
MANQYDREYAPRAYYWGKKPSLLCFKVLELMPPDRPLRLLDIGCGEGRNAVFFARNGYDVTAFDLSPAGV